MNTIVHAQLANLSYLNASSLALGNATVPLQDANALFNNPAGILKVKSTTALLNSTWLYGIKDLAPISGGIIVPSQSGNFGFSTQFWGFENIRESVWSMTYARPLSKKFDVGLRMYYAHSKITDLIIQNNIGFTIGFNTLLINHLRLGFLAQNPFLFKKSNTVSSGHQPVFRLGLAYELNEILIFSSEIKKDLTFPTAFRFGVAYTPLSKITFKGGFETQPVKIGFGLGYFINEKFNIDLAVSSHSTLGMTPALSMGYKF